MHLLPESRSSTCRSLSVPGVNATGPLPSSGAVAIAGSGSSGVRIHQVQVRGGSSGIYLVTCPLATVTFVEGHEMRGPFPRGQGVQFDKCNHSILTDFSCENSNASWTEDNINVYESNNVTIRRGLIDGNNSPSGDGVMVESSGIPGLVTAGLVDSVDAIRQGNGCFGGLAMSSSRMFARGGRIAQAGVAEPNCLRTRSSLQADKKARCSRPDSRLSTVPTILCVSRTWCGRRRPFPKLRLPRRRLFRAPQCVCIVAGLVFDHERVLSSEP